MNKLVARFLSLAILIVPALRPPVWSEARSRQEQPRTTPAAGLSRDRLLSAARAGGDYLLRMQRRDGAFHYFYDAARDRFPPQTYNVVRHAGTVISLLDLYEATRDDRYLGSARRAIRFLETRFRRARTSGAYYVLDFDGTAKLGANGLALVALTKQIALEPGSVEVRNAVRLANQILAMQREDGSFHSRYRIRPNDSPGLESLYYPGEAILGLAGLFKLNGDKRLLAAARRGAGYLIESQRNLPRLPPDAWLMQALEVLYSIEHERLFADHSIALGEAMIADQYDEDDPEGYAGGFGPGPPRATPAASRAEGLLAAYRLARELGDGRASRLALALKASAAFQLTRQISAENREAVPNPRRAAGGFYEALPDPVIRIDFVQHNISSLIGIARTLF